MPRFLLVLAGLLTLVASVRGDDAPATNAPPAAPAAHASKGEANLIAPVRALLESSAKYYGAHKTFEADLASGTSMTMTGSKQQFDSTFHLALSRPNLASVTLQSGMLGGNIVSNGKTMIASMPMAHRYTTADAPAQIGEVFDPMKMALALGGLPLGFESFFQSDPIASLAKILSKSEDLGPDPIGGKPAHHVRLTSDVYVTDLWIADGDAPLLLQAQITPDMSGALKHLTAEQKAKMPPGFDGIKMSRTTTFTNWKIDQPLAATAFDYKPPADYTVMDMHGAAGAEKPHPLIGKPAPDFTLKDLDGQGVPLQSLRGKVVVLDFWATWCGPCGEALPLVSKAALDLKDKGVAFYAVDLQEDTPTIKKFLADKSLAIPVLLDADGKVGGLYQANAIPETVIIDKTGKIQAVHVGYDPDIKTLLTKQLTDLLAGKDLAPEKAK